MSRCVILFDKIMRGYIDESIVIIDGRKYCFLGLVVFSGQPTENIIIKRDI